MIITVQSSYKYKLNPSVIQWYKYEDFLLATSKFIRNKRRLSSLLCWSSRKTTKNAQAIEKWKIDEVGFQIYPSSTYQGPYRSPHCTARNARRLQSKKKYKTIWIVFSPIGLKYLSHHTSTSYQTMPSQIPPVRTDIVDYARLTRSLNCL